MKKFKVRVQLFKDIEIEAVNEENAKETVAKQIANEWPGKFSVSDPKDLSKPEKEKKK